MQKAKCDICGEEFANLGVHKYQKHREMLAPGSIIEVDHPSDLVIDDHLPDKQLSRLISDLKDLLRQYRADLIVKTTESSGMVSEIEITARIQLRR